MYNLESIALLIPEKTLVKLTSMGHTHRETLPHLVDKLKSQPIVKHSTPTQSSQFHHHQIQSTSQPKSGPKPCFTTPTFIGTVRTLTIAQPSRKFSFIWSNQENRFQRTNPSVISTLFDASTEVNFPETYHSCSHCTLPHTQAYFQPPLPSPITQNPSPIILGELNSLHSFPTPTRHIPRNIQTKGLITSAELESPIKAQIPNHVLIPEFSNNSQLLSSIQVEELVEGFTNQTEGMFIIPVSLSPVNTWGMENRLISCV